MSAFEFFFSFYGLLLGFSVAELVGGFARLLHARRDVRFGLLTPMLALFVAIDIATFWNQAWVIFRNAPFNFALLILGLFVASVFYIAASGVFPRQTRPDESLDDHFWANRRVVLLCVLAANLTIVALFFSVISMNGELGMLNLRFDFWIGLGLFTTGTIVAALAPWKRVAVAALALLLVYHGYVVSRAAAALVNNGGWSFITQQP